MTTPAAALDRPDGTRVYPVPLPSDPTGERVELPNISSIGDIYRSYLIEWKLKMALLGVGLRSDVHAQVVAAHTMDPGAARNAELRRVAEVAIEAGQIADRGCLANNEGTALHLFSENLDGGAPNLMDLPAQFREIAEAYMDRMRGITILRREATVYNHAVGYAGTGDILGEFPSKLDEWTAVFDQYDLSRGCFWIDIKTGKLKNEAAMQLAALANAEGIWNARTETFEPLPDNLRRDIGFILDLKRGRARLVPVELGLAWPAFCGGVAVRRFEASKPLHPPLADPAPAPPAPVFAGLPDEQGRPQSEPVHVAEVLPAVVAAIPDEPTPADRAAEAFPGATVVPPTPPEAKRAWLRDQYEQLKSMGDAGVAAMQRHWPAGLPNMRKADEAGHTYSADDLAAIEAALKAATDEAAAPWPDIDPTDPSFQRVANSDPRVLALLERAGLLPADLRAQLSREAAEAGIPSLTTGYLTVALVQRLESLMIAFEDVAAERDILVDTALELVEPHGFTRQAVLDVFGAAGPRDLVPQQLAWLDVLAVAICDRPAVFAERDGRLLVDRPADVLDLFMGSRQKVRDAGRAYAKANGWPAPASADEALADVLIVAHLVAGD